MKLVRVQFIFILLFFCKLSTAVAAVKYDPTSKRCPRQDSKNRYITVPLIHDLQKIAQVENIPNLVLHENLMEQNEGMEISIYYELINEFDSSKELLILIPGGPGESHTFIHDFVKLFEGRSTIFEKFNVIAMDHRGLGCSRPIFPGDEPAESLKMRFAAADIELIRNELTPDRKINVWGYSYGSMLAQTYALLFPDSVDKLFLGGAFSASKDFTQARRDYENLVIDSSVGSDTYEHFINTYPEYRERFLDYTVEQMYSFEGRTNRIPNHLSELLQFLDNGDTELADLIYSNQHNEILPWMMRSISCLEIIDINIEPGIYPLFDSTFGVCREFSQIIDLFDYTESLVNLSMPTFIWGGIYDHVTPAKAMVKMSKYIPDNYLYIDQHIGHDFTRKVDCLTSFIDSFFDDASKNELNEISISSDCSTEPSPLEPN
jgi:pimeloyl-ACP methyl ester carboxylesterase